MEEVRGAVWLCVIDKAPRPNGFTFAFLKKHWETVGPDIYMVVKQFENTGKVDRGCNSSFIILIPKLGDPNTSNDYRPISLIGCLYKIISKVLAERLKSVVSHVIKPIQSAFIKDRNILDGPLLINEVISLHKKSKSKAFLFKIDFEKAFNCINWDYLDSIMDQIDFGQKWQKWMVASL